VKLAQRATKFDETLLMTAPEHAFLADVKRLDLYSNGQYSVVG
jgi:hypothetical protein